MIRIGGIAGQLGALVARVRGTRDAIAGTVHARIVPSPDGRAHDAASNTEVFARLARRNPQLAAPGADLDAPAREAARAAWRGWQSDLRVIAQAAAVATAKALAARLRSGRYVSNTPETRAAKARAGLSTTPGLATEQLAAALEAATATTEETR